VEQCQSECERVYEEELCKRRYETLEGLLAEACRASLAFWMWGDEEVRIVREGRGRLMDERVVNSLVCILIK